MPKLYSSKHIIAVLEKHGFIFISQRGSHAKYRKGKHTAIVVIGKREIPRGTFASIVRQSGLNKVDLYKK
jgi:predicted RNA binding protein YcfA (HicA-like mRNA interferase family)